MPNDFKSPHQPPETDQCEWSALSFSRAATPCTSLEAVVVTNAARLMINALGFTIALVVREHLNQSANEEPFSVVELPCAVRACCFTGGGLTIVSIEGEPLAELVSTHSRKIAD